MTMDTIEQPQELPEATEFKPKGPSSQAKEVLDHITDNGGLYDTEVKPLLQSGREAELCNWLKKYNLIKSSMECPTETCNGKSLTWSAARSIDKYSWYCSECKKRTSLRTNSFFLQIKCDLKLWMQLIVAWCQSIPTEDVVSHLGIKNFIVKKAFEKLDEVAKMYVSNHKHEWILGESSENIIIDEFPGGYMTEFVTPITKKNSNYTILCIAEVGPIPLKFWMHILNENTKSTSSKSSKNQQSEIRCGMVEEALKEIRAHVKPGSRLIANSKATCCSYQSLSELTDYELSSFENLKRLNPPGTNEILEIIETIWQIPLGICEDVQETTRANGLQCLYGHLWSQRFARKSNEAFKHIIQHIAECFPCT